jgi:pyrimidine deaminase RibD-like protein
VPPPPPGDEHWLALAVDLGRRCPPSATAFSVGCVIVAADGTELEQGYSRAEEPHDHAEEVALRRFAVGLRADPARATLYTSLEPCSARSSRPRTCTQLILAAGIGRVVFAWREPRLFVDCEGAELLAAAGVEVVELPELADQVRAVNSHLGPF